MDRHAKGGEDAEGRGGRDGGGRMGLFFRERNNMGRCKWLCDKQLRMICGCEIGFVLQKQESGDRSQESEFLMGGKDGWMRLVGGEGVRPRGLL